MPIFTLDVELLLPLPVDTVFPFFADAGNLEAITPPWLHFHIMTPRPIPMHPGALIDYKLRLHGFPIRWRTEIQRWEPPHLFVDQQLRGPYTLWHHTHTFEERDGGTLVKDRVRYGVPLGVITQKLFVKAQVDQIFRFRQRAISRMMLGRELASYPEPVHGRE